MSAQNPALKQRRPLWPWLLALPPLVAVLGCALTVILALRHPDHVIQQAPEPITPAEQHHVTNSVVPPLH